MALLAVPNFSEGRDQLTIEAIAAALGSAARLLDIHSDADHNRTVYTVVGTAQDLGDAVLKAAAVAFVHINLGTHEGAHPHVGVLDVAPFVYTESSDRGTAAAAALVTADRLAATYDMPVFLYGMLTAHRVTRAAVRRGGPASLASRMASGDATPDFGPPRLHPSAGATLVSARPPLIAFNLELEAPARIGDARRIAAELRQLPGVRAIGIQLSGGVAQVSTNIEEPDVTSPRQVAEAVAHHARITTAELVGLPPRRYFEDFPADIPVRYRRMLEEALL